MNAFLAIFTYFSYFFILVMYSIKIVKYLRFPVHLRWELYPFSKNILSFLKEYILFESYYKWKKSYWLALYISHIGFVLLIFFQMFGFIGSLAEISGIDISSTSDNFPGISIYYAAIISGAICFIAGIVGSIGLFTKRLTDSNLRAYASPEMYFGYIFNLILSLVGLYVWCYVDPSFQKYREFWKGMITFKPVTVEPSLALLIIILSLHLIYLPFTRAFHYISRIFAYFLIRWDDKPNIRGSKLEHTLQALLNQNISWAAPHIKAGKKWNEQ